MSNHLVDNANILFVIAQAGQAAFCMPLWKKWTDNPPPGITWHIWASADAQKVMPLSENLPLLGNWNDATTLDGIAATGNIAYSLIISSATLSAQEIMVSQEASQKNIKHVQFIDTWYDYGHRVKGSNPAGRAPDGIWVIDDNAVSEATTQGLPASRLKAIGHPVWEKALSQSQNTAPRDVVVFAGQPLSQIPALNSLGYNEKKVWDLLVKFQKDNPDLISELIYAPHPAEKQPPQHFSAGTRLIAPHENPLTTAGTMIGMFTALMTEGYLRGQAIISFQPNLDGENKCALSRQNLIPLETSSEMSLFKKALHSSNRAGTSPILARSLTDSLEKFERSIETVI